MKDGPNPSEHGEFLDVYNRCQCNKVYSQEILLIRVPRFATPGKAKRWFWTNHPQILLNQFNTDQDLWEHHAVQITFCCEDCERKFVCTYEWEESQGQFRYGYYRRIMKDNRDCSKRRYHFLEIFQTCSIVPQYSADIRVNNRRWAQDFFNKIK